MKVDLAVLALDSTVDIDKWLKQQPHKCLVAIEFKFGKITDPTPSFKKDIEKDIKKLRRLKKEYDFRRGYFCFISVQDEPEEEVGNMIATLRGKWYKNYYREAQGFHDHPSEWRVKYR